MQGASRQDYRAQPMREFLHHFSTVASQITPKLVKLKTTISIIISQFLWVRSLGAALLRVFH